MKIAVCIKRVPDSETRVKIAADGKSLEEAGVKFILNPYDEFAVEEALRRKEKAGPGEVVVIALGPAAAQETIRTALAMGADRGILLQADRIPTDGLEVAKALAAELKGAGFDLILFGKMAIDDYNHQVGPMVAELLDLPCVTTVAHLEIEGMKGVAEREIEGGVEVVEFPLPAVLTTDKGLNEPRYPALKGIMAAKKKPLDVKPATLGAVGGAPEILALTPPPERKEGKIVGEGPAAGAALVGRLREEAKVRRAPSSRCPASATGKDLAPRVAARLGRPLVQDVVDLAVENGAVTVIRPVYAGKALLKLKVTGTPALLSLRPNVFTPVERPKAGTQESAAAGGPAGRVVVKAIKAAEAGALDVAEAPIIVSGGRGLKEPANFKVLEQLAAAFAGRAAVGASRAVVDAGWRPHADQVGQTGKTVSPTLYVAVGISGAIQHLAGMRTSKVTVASNKDKDATSSKVGDYGIVREP